jgi:hypothetical protein
VLNKIKTLYRAWVRTGRKIAGFQIRLVFSLAYIFFILPFGLVFKRFSKQPESGWHPVKPETITMEKARNQF